jgi:uncharacterized protein (TIGR02246 family)
MKIPRAALVPAVLSLIGMVVIAPVPSALGQERPADERAIRETVEAVATALNARDWEAAAARFAEDGDVLVPGSPLASGGRAAIAAFWEQGWSDAPDDRRITVTIQAIRFLGPDVAIAELTAEFSAGEPARDRATFVIVRTGDAWQVAALRVMQAERS